MNNEIVCAIRRVLDLATLMPWRREVLATVFGEEPTPELLDANREFYRRHIADDTHYAVVASDAETGADMGCGAICLYDEMPSPDNPSGRCAYLMNIYVRPAFRRHGVGDVIVRHLVAEAQQRGCGKIYLETTDHGRPLYREVGFHDMPDMMKLTQSQV